MQRSVIEWAITALNVLWWALAGIFVVLLLTGSISGWPAWVYVGIAVCVGVAQRVMEHKYRRLRQPV